MPANLETYAERWYDGWLQLNEAQPAPTRTPDPAAPAPRQLNRTLGNRYGEAADLDTIETIEHAQGRYAEALACFRQSLPGLREAGSRRRRGRGAPQAPCS